MIRVWHKIIKLRVDNHEDIAYTLNLWYINENNVQHDENIAHNDEGCPRITMKVFPTP